MLSQWKVSGHLLFRDDPDLIDSQLVDGVQFEFKYGELRHNPAKRADFLEKLCSSLNSQDKVADAEPVYVVPQRLDFAALRQHWALKAPIPTDDVIDMHRRRDQAGNPHNDGYGKCPRRDTNEIIGDLCYCFADTILTNQYGRDYTSFLQTTHEERWGRWVRRN